MTSADAEVPFVGGTDELERLDVLLEKARSGTPVVAVIEGPAGSGKSTLLRRFRHRHPDLPVCSAAGLPWERDHAGALVARLAGELDSDPVALGIRLAERWAVHTARRPLLVLVDDADDADPVSLQAIVSALARLREAHLLVVLARAYPAENVLDRLDGVRVPVAPLRPEQVRLLAARAAGVDLPMPVARRLCAHTAGIPGHLLEILRDSTPARWSDWQTRLPPPRSVLCRVQATVDACRPAARSLVEAAAVLGPDATLADAAALAGVDDPVAGLDEAYRAGLLAPAAGHGLDALTFRGPFVRAAVYATLRPARRHELHLRAADIVADETTRLRHRVEAAPLPDDALAAELLDLAERKAEEGAWAVVAGALLDASRISRHRADRADRLIQAVDALAGAGLLGPAIDALPDLEALPASARRDATLAYVAIQRGRRVEAEAYLDTAWRLRGSDRRAAAVVCQRHVLHALADWDGDELVRWADRALRYADPGSPEAVESHAIVGLGHAARGEPDRAVAAYRAAIAASPTGPRQQRARMGFGWLHLALDDPETARRELEFAVPTVRLAGSNRISLWALAWLARTHFALGDWDAALRAAERAQVLLTATGLDLLSPLLHWTAAQVHALRGQGDLAERHALAGAAGEHDYLVMSVPAALARAHVAEAAADYPAVVRHLAPLAARPPRGGLDEPGFWPWQDVYATALVRTNRLAAADEFLTPLERLAEQRRHRSTLARLSRVRGQLLAALGDLAGAERAFARARDLLADLPLPYERARVDFAHGLTLRRAGHRRDAALRLSAARLGFATLDARGYLERCDRELKTGARGSEVLTEQERAVSALVANGMTNKEVAAEMMLSVKTVQFHLTRVYAKLRVRSRAELAARFSGSVQGGAGGGADLVLGDSGGALHEL